MPAGSTANELNRRPIGTGPFRFDSWTPGERSLFKKNSDYWDGAPYVDELEIVAISDPIARAEALLGGQVDVTDFLDLAQARGLASNSAIRILRSPSDSCVPIYMRLDQKPFSDPRVRLAFKLLIDRSKMVDTALLGFGRVGNDLFGPSHASYNRNLPQRKYDPDRARSLLKAAGQEGMKVELPTSSAIPGMLESATLFAQQAQEVGVTVALRKVPADSYFTKSSGYLKAPLFQTNWQFSFESVALQALVPGGPYRETHWETERPDWVRRFRSALATRSRARSRRCTKRCSRISGGRADTSSGVSRTLSTRPPRACVGHGRVPNFRWARTTTSACGLRDATRSLFARQSVGRARPCAPR